VAEFALAQLTCDTPGRSYTAVYGKNFEKITSLMTQIKLIVTDVDGTLLNSEGLITQETICALQEAMAAGVQVVLASARMRVGMAHFAEQVGTHAPMICCDGAQIYRTPAGPVWQQYTLPQTIAEEIVAIGDHYGWELITTAGDATYYLQRDGKPLGEYAPGRVVVPSNRAALYHAPVSRIVVYEPAAMDYIYEHCWKYKEQIRTHLFAWPGEPPHSLAIFPVEADKGQAVRFLMQHLNIPAEQVLAIGDNQNDSVMLAAAGVSVAMGNATDELKEQADHIAPDNDSDGLAWAIRTLVTIVM
jgi:Cof subfamily protein (haloacid dehalogenase superfamily)